MLRMGAIICGHLWAALVFGLASTLSTTDSVHVQTTTSEHSSTLTTTTMSTTVLMSRECSNVTWCLADHHCAQCLAAINASVGFPHTLKENYQPTVKPTWYAIAALHEMLTTPSCSMTPPTVLRAALTALTQYPATCGVHYGMTMRWCIIHEYVATVACCCERHVLAYHSENANEHQRSDPIQAHRTSALRCRCLVSKRG